jgi:hypothetical protein
VFPPNLVAITRVAGPLWLSDGRVRLKKRNFSNKPDGMSAVYSPALGNGRRDYDEIWPVSGHVSYPYYCQISFQFALPFVRCNRVTGQVRQKKTRFVAMKRTVRWRCIRPLSETDGWILTKFGGYLASYSARIPGEFHFNSPSHSSATAE